MKSVEALGVLTEEVILSRILVLRGVKVMIDCDLADLYGVTTKRLNEQVKRNKSRFPEDFMFQLDEREKKEVVAFCDHLSRLKFSHILPYAFTEHGAVMLASIINSERAILVNIQIVRVFIKMRLAYETSSRMIKRLEELDIKENEQDQQILLIFEYLKQLEQVRQEETVLGDRKRIGFRRADEK